MSNDLEAYDDHEETMRALMAAVRTAADRMKQSLPTHVDVNEVVSAGYLALTQALAYWQEGSAEVFEVHAMRRASAAMVAVGRTTNPPPSQERRRFVSEMSRVQESIVDALSPELGTLDLATIVSPPLDADRDVALEEIGVHVA